MVVVTHLVDSHENTVDRTRGWHTPAQVCVLGALEIFLGDWERRGIVERKAEDAVVEALRDNPGVPLLEDVAAVCRGESS
jgi:hypothetical protein